MESNEQNRMPESDYERTVPLTVQKTNKSKAPIVLSLLLVFALAGSGGLGWLYYQENKNATEANKNLAVARQEIKGLKEAAAKAASEKASDDDTVVDARSTDSELIIKTALAYAKSDKTFASSDKIEVNQLKQSGDFASVNVYKATTGPNISVILKKSQGLWLAIYSGTSSPGQGFVDRYSIPTSIVAP